MWRTTISNYYQLSQLHVTKILTKLLPTRVINSQRRRTVNSNITKLLPTCYQIITNLLPNYYQRTKTGITPKKINNTNPLLFVVGNR